MLAYGHDVHERWEHNRRRCDRLMSYPRGMNIYPRGLYRRLTTTDAGTSAATATGTARLLGGAALVTLVAGTTVTEGYIKQVSQP